MHSSLQKFQGPFGQHSSPCMEPSLFADMTVFLTKSNLTKPNITIQKNFLTLYVWTVCQVTECQVEVNRVPSVTECQVEVDRVQSMTECQVGVFLLSDFWTVCLVEPP